MTDGQRIRIRETTKRIEHLIQAMLDADDGDDEDGVEEALDGIESEVERLRAITEES